MSLKNAAPVVVKQAGVTLVELVVSITVISVALVAVLGAFSQTASSSANPAIRAQATAIASAYMEEALLQPYTDPDGADTGSCEEGAANRSAFDDVNDYSCINDSSGAKDQTGASITGLTGYNVQMAVTSSTLNGIAAQRIDVTTTYDGIASLSIKLTAYRVNY